MIKAVGQVHGEVIGHHVNGVKHPVVDVPADWAYNGHSLCFVFHSNVPANCGVEVGDPAGTTEVSSWVSTYNPLYYYLVGWPSLFMGGSAGVYAMRLVSALLGALLLAWGFQAAMGATRSRWMPLGMAFVASPMVIYLMGAVNPNGIEIAAAAAVWIGTLRLLQSHRAGDGAVATRVFLPRWYLWMIVSVAAIVLANARATGPLWLVVVVLLCMIAVGWKSVKALFTTASSYWGLAVISVGGIFSLFWTLGGGSLSNQAEESDAPLVGASFVTGFTFMLRTTITFLKQAFGYFGWFDAPMPDFAYWPYIAAITALLLLAFTATNWRSVRTLLIVTAAAFLVPALVQAYGVSQTGIIWQGRYALFLYVGIMIVAGWLLSAPAGDRIAYLAPRITWVGASLLMLYGIIAYVLVMRRYVTGNDAMPSDMWLNPQWQPPFGWPTLVILFTLVSAASVVLLGVLATRTARLETADAADAADAEGAADVAEELNVQGAADTSSWAPEASAHRG